ncbi:MAG: hypothetical protein AAGA90_19790 [Actinomycetota bacterium]
MTRRPSASLALFLALAVLAGACGGSDDETTPADDAGPTDGTGATDGTDDGATDTSGIDDTGASDIPAGEPRTGADLSIGLPAVTLLAPSATDAGSAPRFEWSPVEGAASYQLVIRGPAGPIWAWAGADTGVWLGGLDDERPPGLAGPVVVAGSCWSVVALDADARPIAVSPLVAVSPDASEHDCTTG